MDAKRQGLQKKLEDLLSQATAVAVQMQGMDQGGGTPHFDDIELPAHALGQRLSRMIQEGRAREVAADQAAEAACPSCGCSCRVSTKKRQMQSADGPLELLETVAKCRRCRRSFFPSAGSAGT
jgi:hypothetical protein